MPEDGFLSACFQKVKDALGLGNSKDVVQQSQNAGATPASEPLWDRPLVHTPPWASAVTAAKRGGRSRWSLISLSSSTFYNLCKLERFTHNFILISLLVVHLLVTEPAAGPLC